MGTPQTVITGAGLAVAGAGALLIWMGIKDYSLTTVLDAALRGEPLVSDSGNTGVIRDIADEPDKLEPVPGTGGGGADESDKLEPVPGTGGGGSVAPKLLGFEGAHLFKGVDGINWDGGIF